MWVFAQYLYKYVLFSSYTKLELLWKKKPGDHELYFLVGNAMRLLEEIKF